MNAIARLCPNCGLCCDSTLFSDVELRAGDDADRLAELGLSLNPKANGKLAFAQPCPCFDGRLCSIYGQRPKRCQLFECGLLKKVQAGVLTTSAALTKISEAKTLAKNVRRLLRSCGDEDDEAALAKRYARTMKQPIDLAKDARGAERRGELMLAVADLMHALQRDFFVSDGG